MDNFPKDSALTDSKEELEKPQANGDGSCYDVIPIELDDMNDVVRHVEPSDEEMSQYSDDFSSQVSKTYFLINKDIELQ